MFKRCGAQITQAYDKHTGTRRGFGAGFTEYAKEISIITLPSHRRRDRKSTTPLELSQLRALNGQLLWLGMQCLPQLLAPLSLLMGQTPQATVGKICEVNKVGSESDCVGKKTPLKIHAHHYPVVVTYTDAGWTTRPDSTSQGGELLFIANSQLLQNRESNTSKMSWHSSETQEAADGDDEAVYIRFMLERRSVRTAGLAKLAI